MSTSFENHLNSFTESEWLSAVEGLLPDIHSVDREAIQRDGGLPLLGGGRTGECGHRRRARGVGHHGPQKGQRQDEREPLHKRHDQQDHS